MSFNDTTMIPQKQEKASFEMNSLARSCTTISHVLIKGGNIPLGRAAGGQRRRKSCNKSDM